ncbi:MAG: hypothetical protein CM1200mP7_2050 [Chloroflexota bacterium]|nr:MAG: hypothetical protein CM1200mP7_2050 [Chloroflexota bacterium]
MLKNIFSKFKGFLSAIISLILFVAILLWVLTETSKSF